jgi:hypothetical protein
MLNLYYYCKLVVNALSSRVVLTVYTLVPLLQFSHLEHLFFPSYFLMARYKPAGLAAVVNGLKFLLKYNYRFFLNHTAPKT